MRRILKPTNNGTEILKLPLVNKKWTKKAPRIKNKLWDRNLPEPNPNKNNGLSIISGSKDPIISEILFKSNFLTIGISRINNGKATWNIGKILNPSFSN